MANAYTLTTKEKDLLERFINGRHNYYYFKNFLDITSGNLRDAIALYEFDRRLRIVLFNYILKFELILKHDFLTFAERAGASTTFWNNSSYFLRAATIVSKNHTYSKFDALVKKTTQDITHKVFSNSPIQNVNIFYATSFGTFLRYFELLEHRYKNDFILKHFNSKLDYLNLKKYLNSIKLIRNRCAHSNHIVSPKLRLEQKRTKLTNFSNEFNIFYTEFSKCIQFIYRTLTIEDKQAFKRDLLIILDKYMKISNKYYKQHTIDYNLNAKLRKIWRVKLPLLNKLIYKLKFYVKI